MKRKIILGTISILLIVPSISYANSSVPVNEIYGSNRVETSVAISNKAFEKSENAVIVSGNNYADSISSLPVSSFENCPILLTKGHKLENTIKNELKRLNVKKVSIIGGSKSVSEKVASDIKNEGIEVKRIYGINRYETNRKVLENYFSNKKNDAIFVSGENFADSISIGCYAHKNRIPIVLLPTKIDDNIKKYIIENDFKNNIIVGGKSSVNKEYEKYIKAKRYYGKTRYETSFLINKELFSDSTKIFLTSGQDFADALSGVPYASLNDSNLVLYNRNPIKFSGIENYSEVNVIGGMLRAKINRNLNKKDLIAKKVFNDDYIFSANKLIDKKISVLENADLYLHYDGSFKKFLNEKRSVQRRIFGFFFLNDLVNAYNDTKDRKYFDIGMKMIKEFETENASIDNSMVWHDETVARRLSYYLNFYSNFNQLMNAEQERLMENSMKKIANLISNTDFWAGNNNHGMFQDMACLEYGMLMGDKKIFDKAERRLIEYFLSTFDNDGVHLENSPEYHFVILKEYRNFINYMKDGNSPNYEKLLKRYEKTKYFSRAILLPDLNIPNIGDSKTMKIDLKDYYDDYSLDEYNEKFERHRFLNSGYDIVKNKDSYLLLRAGYLKKYHHHDDDLSFWLYKNGNIITEAGAFGYEYSNPYAKYSKGFSAHNTLVVDGKNDSVGSDVKLGNTKYEDMLCGVTKRIKDIVFKRSIKFDNELSDISIIDDIHSMGGKKHNYKLYFHLDPAINPVKEDNVVKLFRDGEFIGQLKSDEKINIIDDMYFPDYDRNIKNTKTIVIESYGSDKAIITKIILN
ncbi:cell wall-binding repeat-containing protein [Peptostreptococcus canis]|uniref:Cell wall-binding protein n=1 Tax=Peptostreptococcus canis TaxID=1159213 RepID=A0ABR6TKM9_9FIRM|nr:cell wall-binding repeat-containing protein [Peptostreptococcus canis]MBC2575959.1 cell wall-binding protein [Peptostreptococcus canis]MBP1997919.1 putative cell wall-binding protein [Peptostreptococcus canis]